MKKFKHQVKIKSAPLFFSDTLPYFFPSTNFILILPVNGFPEILPELPLPFSVYLDIN